MTELMNADQLGEYLDRFTRTLFRMETLPAYAVDADGDDYARWLAGEPEPTWSRLSPWLDVLRAERDAGKVSTRVRVLSDELTDYQKYSAEWGYRYTTVAGEDVRILHFGEHQLPRLRDELLPLLRQDWWIVDDAEVVSMHYGPAGEFEGAEVLPVGVVGVYRDVQLAARAAAEPFDQWWERHPELRRQVAA